MGVFDRRIRTVSPRTQSNALERGADRRAKEAQQQQTSAETRSCCCGKAGQASTSGDVYSCGFGIPGSRLCLVACEGFQALPRLPIPEEGQDRHRTQMSHTTSQAKQAGRSASMGGGCRCVGGEVAKVWPGGAAARQILTVPSVDPDTISSPVGTTETDRTQDRGLPPQRTAIL